MKLKPSYMVFKKSLDGTPHDETFIKSVLEEAGLDFSGFQKALEGWGPDKDGVITGLPVSEFYSAKDDDDFFKSLNLSEDDRLFKLFSDIEPFSRAIYSRLEEGFNDGIKSLRNFIENNGTILQRNLALMEKFFGCCFEEVVVLVYPGTYSDLTYGYAGFSDNNGRVSQTACCIPRDYGKYCGDKEVMGVIEHEYVHDLTRKAVGDELGRDWATREWV